MGTNVEINDTLQLTTEQGFPADLLDRRRHCEKPVTIQDVAGKIFEFRGKPNPRIFQLDPVRVYFVHNIKEKWLFWGRILIQTQMIRKTVGPDGSWKEGDWETSGTYQIMDVYDPDYQRTFTVHEAPKGKNYFENSAVPRTP